MMKQSTKMQIRIGQRIRNEAAKKFCTYNICNGRCCTYTKASPQDAIETETRESHSWNMRYTKPTNICYNANYCGHLLGDADESGAHRPGPGFSHAKFCNENSGLRRLQKLDCSIFDSSEGHIGCFSGIFEVVFVGWAWERRTVVHIEEWIVRHSSLTPPVPHPQF